jgi:hypothetical protein
MMYDKLFTPYKINSMTLPNRLVLPAIVSLICCLFLPKNCLAFSYPVLVDKHYVLSEARKKYYNLRNHGLKDFRAQADVNWQLIPDSIAKAIHFDVLLDSENNIKVTHSFDHLFTDTSTIRPVNLMTNDVENIISDFISLGNKYLFDTLFSDLDSTYSVIDSAGDYWISYKAGDSYIRERMTKDFIIQETFEFSPTAAAHIVTKFEQSSEGFLLSSFDLTADVRSNGSISDHAHSMIECDYTNVDGFRLPHTVKFTVDKIPRVEYTFSNYTVKRID